MNTKANRKNGTTPRNDQSKRRRAGRTDGAPGSRGVKPSPAAVEGIDPTGMFWPARSAGNGYLMFAPTTESQFLVIRSVALFSWSRVGKTVPDVSGSLASRSAGIAFAAFIASNRAGLQ